VCEHVFVRWDEQRVENDLRLPGVGDGTVVRTFDAPEAMGINFHEVRARSALNHVPGDRFGFKWTVNPFRGCTHACTFCFARRTHNYLDFGPGEDFEREIVVKVNVPELVRAELRRPTWKRELVALGTNTDPYQWVESRYRFMPEILEALEEAETPVTVLTKSPLVLRDIELFERMAKKVPVSVNLSVPTLDEAAWRATEPHTPSPAARLDAVEELRTRGIESGVLVAPLMPGINDEPEQVQPILERAKEADASFLTGIALHLRGEVKDVFFAWLQTKRPDLLPKYEELYKGRAYLQPQQRKQATRALKGWGRSRGARSRQTAPRTGGADLGDRPPPVAGGGGTKSATGPAGQQPSSVELSFSDIQQAWPAVLQKLSETAPALAATFEGARPTSFDGAGLQVGFPPEMTFNKKKADKPERRDTLAAAFAAVTGVGLRPTFVLLEGNEAPPPDTPAPGSEDVDEEELLERLKSEFDAEEVG
jgi:DNA repair photolyase